MNSNIIVRVTITSIAVLIDFLRKMFAIVIHYEKQCVCNEVLNFPAGLMQMRFIQFVIYFFVSLLLHIRCIPSLSQAFLNNTELKIFGHYRESNTGSLA